MRSLRRASQALSLLVFLWLFLKAGYPYLRFVQKLLPALIILRLTIPLGRFFCGWICPLGTIIDIGDHFIRRGNKGKSSQWKLVLLIFLLVSSLISVQLVWFFDPIALLNRVLTTSFYPLLIYILDKIPGLHLCGDLVFGNLWPTLLVSKPVSPRCPVECLKMCSTTGGFLQPAFLEAGWEGIWTPVGNPHFGYCEYTCNLCTQVCPTEAIHPLSLTQKQRTKIGTAILIETAVYPGINRRTVSFARNIVPFRKRRSSSLFSR